MKNPKIAIVLLNWNGFRDTVECILSLKKSTYKNIKIIVVDNNSDNKEAERLIKRFGRYIIVIKNRKNYGVAEGNNIGIREAIKDFKIKYVIMMNNDLIVVSNAIKSLVKAAEKNNKIGMVASHMMNYYNRKKVDNLGICLTISGLGYNRKTEKYPLFCPCSGFGLYSVKALKEIALPGLEIWDKDFFAYVDELDVGFRMYLRGYTSFYVSDAIAYHKEGVYSGGPSSDFSIYQGHRNNLWFLVKNFPWQFWLEFFLWIIFTQIGSIFFHIKKKKALLIIKAKLAALKGTGKMIKKRKYIQARRKISISNLKQNLIKSVILNPNKT